jgi:sulfur relay (sulfurtransferase) DsrC/TusE family protein
MLMKAMDKYASEMATLLSSIENADLKKSFWDIIKTMNGLFKKK